ncbi:DUF2254 domain-containing protein [Demequina sediminicola]|uniref:DUF2254 domain-containing protein n=1 Tax=Demequina sediminicola TaxID=1095026 RepID=UPI000AB24609|nr:DUF2254 domain-containing protein [Demequina sediminicola]
MQHWRTWCSRLTTRMWFRLVIFTAVAIAVVLIAWALGPYLPHSWVGTFSDDAAEMILQIMATSMLAVTTFSLTAMISAYGSAAQGTTPRATQLLIEDRTSQNALSTFLGSFVFAVVGLVALSAADFGREAQAVLFAASLIVIGVVVGTLLRWIHHLTSFGRVPDVIDRVERAATEAATTFACEPHLGGAAPVHVPDHVWRLRAASAGCVTGIAVADLQAWAEQADARVHVRVLPGVTVGQGTTLACVESATDPGDDDSDTLLATFRIEPHRTFEQDPRLGFVALAEIASRALSPSTNDPGTAVEALNAMERVMTAMITADATDEVRFPRVYVDSPTMDDLIEDGLRPPARDGAGLVEIGLRIQRVVQHLMSLDCAPDDREALRQASVRAERRALAALRDPGDVELVAAASSEARGN